MYLHPEMQNPIWVNLPDICPRCGKDFNPQELNIIKNHRSNFGSEYAVSVLCPFCEKTVYFDVYCHPKKNQGYIREVYPEVKFVDIPKEIAPLFPQFYELYRQSQLAEIKGCTDICGAGFRKALETLVKQYVAKLCPDAEFLISKESLSQTIQRIDNPRIKTLAAASTWLGNDQTHLVPKHPTYNLADMKVFMKALCYHILMEEEFKRAQVLTNPEPLQ